MDLELVRSVIQRYVKSHMYQAACYWADKAVSLSGGSTEDVTTLAHCYLLTGQHRRAVRLIREAGLQRTDPDCRYLAARCLYESHQHQEALTVLQPDTDPDHPHQDDLPAHVLLLKGRLYEALDNRQLAAQCFRQALTADVMCHEAFEALVGHQMLSLQEERQLLESLPFDKQLPAAEARTVRALYRLQLKKYTVPAELEPPADALPPALLANADVTVCRAEQLYYNCDYGQCHRLTGAVLERDPDHTRCLPVHLACLVERRRTNALFQLAHRLVDTYPESALAWFAVGCYYYTTGKMDPARRYLSKATSLDRAFGPAWLAYGHSFALENEHDQAISAYFRASQLMQGCHLPFLYVGLEYGLTNNARLALQFFNQALAVAPNDPFVLHEMGVIAFNSKDYPAAEQHFSAALEQVQQEWHTITPEKWEPLLNNLGHTYRKLGRHEQALQAHQQALVLDPENASTYSAIGFTYALMECPGKAVDAFHKALSLRRDDAFSTQMLGNVLEQLLSSQAACALDLPPPLVVLDQPSVSLTPVPPAGAGGDLSLRQLDSSDDMSLELDVEK